MLIPSAQGRLVAPDVPPAQLGWMRQLAIEFHGEAEVRIQDVAVL